MNDHKEKIDQALKMLNDSTELHNRLVMDLMQPGPLFLSDIYATTVLNRSLSLIRGFCRLVEERNYTCAAPLVRLQLDNLLRYLAMGLAPDHHTFVLNVVNGIPVRKQKDRDGKLMTDAYLLDQMTSTGEDFLWIRPVYEKASGYIHFSDQHILDAFDGRPPIPGTSPQTFTTFISQGDAFMKDADYLDIAETFNKITEALLWLVSFLAEDKKKGPPKPTN